MPGEDPTGIGEAGKFCTEETPLHVVSIIRNLRKKTPFISRKQIVETLQKEYGVELSSATVGRIIARHGLFYGNTQAHDFRFKANFTQRGKRHARLQ